MGLAILSRLPIQGMSMKMEKKELVKRDGRNLTHGERNHPYVIQGIDTEDKGMKDFLFTLGCFEGERVTVISQLAENYIINVKDARYSIDAELAKAIKV